MPCDCGFCKAGNTKARSCFVVAVIGLALIAAFAALMMLFG